ncbi:MAG: Lrp/AsnC family transcriptional regulator [Peptococcaceae bacterium]|nr:Lrp/AsnC family transcriptional regulator [Peptococcaceae bacterium]
MDGMDKEILDILRKNSRISIKKLAEQVFLSPPAVTARIERMQAEGLITGFYTELDMEKQGFPLTAFINLSMAPAKRKEFTAYVLKCPNVLECSHVSGQYSMLIKAAFSGTAQLEHFVARLQQFGATQTQVVFSTVVKPRNLL